MSSDDQYFLDVLSSIPNDVKKYSAEIADSIDRHFESVSTAVRETLSSASWIPQSARPTPPRRVSPPALIPSSYWDQVQDWVSKNQAITAAVVAFVGTGAWLIIRRRRSQNRKRRARRASNGARKEVVVVAGSPTEPITRSICQDLERRGFVVYVIVNTVEEEQIVLNESRADVRPLHLDLVDPMSSHQAIEKFNRVLSSPQYAFHGATPHNLHFAGFISIPDMTYPSGPVETIPLDAWSDALNVKVIGTVATTQLFLPTIRDSRARVIILTPNIVRSLSPPFHGPESSIVGALEGFTGSLIGEMATMGIEVCQFKLGTLDYGAVGGKHHLQPCNPARADVLSWPAAARAAYAKNYLAQSAISGGRNGGSALRELHNSVFDALTQKRPRRIWRIGSGSLVYDMVGRWVPAGIVGWMLGIRRISREDFLEEGEASTEWEKVERAV